MPTISYDTQAVLAGDVVEQRVEHQAQLLARRHSRRQRHDLADLRRDDRREGPRDERIHTRFIVRDQRRRHRRPARNGTQCDSGQALVKRQSTRGPHDLGAALGGRFA